MNVLAVIPARKGSQRLPDKNVMTILQDGGVSYTLVDAALAFTTTIPVSTVVLTTDYEMSRFPMASPQRLKGKKFIFVNRAPELCGPDVPMWKVVDDTLSGYFDWFHTLPDAILLLQPTSPLRDPSAVLQAINLLESGKAQAVVSVNPAYEPDGNFYLVDIDVFREAHSFYPEGVVPSPQEWRYSIDIDTEQDFRMAQHLMNGSEFKYMFRR